MSADEPPYVLPLGDVPHISDADLKTPTPVQREAAYRLARAMVARATAENVSRGYSRIPAGAPEEWLRTRAAEAAQAAGVEVDAAEAEVLATWGDEPSASHSG